MTLLANDLLVRAARNQPTPRTPVWLMRQAGRSDPGYRMLRRRVDLPLEAMFRDADLSAEASLLPGRIGVDGIILFQDILTPLAPMGAEFVFRPGPLLASPITGERDINALRRIDPACDLAHVGETIRRVRDALGGGLPVIGFAGAPLTLAMFLIEGCSPGPRPDRARALMRGRPDTMHRLLSKLADMTVDYLRYQLEAGVHILQLFESMADMVTVKEYTSFAHPYHQRIFDAVGEAAPRILFAKRRSEPDLLATSGADVISVPSNLELPAFRGRVGETVALQGNLDNQLVATAPVNEIRSVVRRCIVAGGGRGHILNLNHGLLPDTPFENVRAVVDEAHRFSVARAATGKERVVSG